MTLWTQHETMALGTVLLFIALAWVCIQLYEIWRDGYIRKTVHICPDTTELIRRVMDTPNESCQLLHWQVFKNTSQLQHDCWYLFELKTGSYIVEQYDQELNWQFYVPHTDYVRSFAKVKNGQIHNRTR
tara:strand:+ start:2937 stop:3323 length:387 start_codon:yes stop_codon:yes gene_type:complete